MPDMGATVSVVIPCFNMGAFVEEAVASALAQTRPPLEVIVVDDGSDDAGTQAALERIAAAGTTCVIRGGRGGVARARNRGIEAARGSHVLPLDADDLLAPEFLEKALGLLEHDPGIAIVGTDAELFGARTGVLTLPRYSRRTLLSRNLFFATTLFRKSDWQRAGGYCTGFRYGWEDWDFWIALTKSPLQVARIAEPLLKYRIRSTSRDRSMALWQKGAMMLLMLARHWTDYLRSPSALWGLVENAALTNKGT